MSPLAPLTLTAEQVAFLRDRRPDLPCVGPNGEPAGYWVDAKQYEELRRLAHAEVERRLDGPAGRTDLPPAYAEALEGVTLADTPAAVLQQVVDRWEAAGLRPGGGRGTDGSPGGHERRAA